MNRSQIYGVRKRTKNYFKNLFILKLNGRYFFHLQILDIQNKWRQVVNSIAFKNNAHCTYIILLKKVQNSVIGQEDIGSLSRNVLKLFTGSKSYLVLH